MSSQSFQPVTPVEEVQAPKDPLQEKLDMLLDVVNTIADGVSLLVEHEMGEVKEKEPVEKVPEKKPVPPVAEKKPAPESEKEPVEKGPVEKEPKLGDKLPPAKGEVNSGYANAILEGTTFLLEAAYEDLSSLVNSNLSEEWKKSLGDIASELGSASEVISKLTKKE